MYMQFARKKKNSNEKLIKKLYEKVIKLKRR